MIKIEWVRSYAYTESNLESTYVLVEKLRDAGFTNIPDSFHNTSWMKLFNKLNAGATIYMSVCPYESEINYRLELVWSSNRDHLIAGLNLRSEDI